MTCEHTKLGEYQFTCEACCARLIKSARPNRKLQEGHIAAIKHFHKSNFTYFWERIKPLLKD